MKTPLFSISSLSLLLSVAPSLAAEPATNAAPFQSSIAYVPTRHDTVKDLLQLADVGTNDVVYDLGSGDGRIVIAAVRDFGARRAVGVEIDPRLVRESRENAAKAGVAGRVEIIEGDLFTNDFSLASVVVLYTGKEANLDLRAKLVRALKPGSRVVSHQFSMGEWLPDKELDVRTVFLGMYGEQSNPFSDNPNVPEYRSNGRFFGHDYLSVWIVPAPVAGVWRGKVSLKGKDVELELTLHQRLSGISGSFDYAGPTNFTGSIWGDQWGGHLRFQCIAGGMRYGEFLLTFDGQVREDTLTGTLDLSQGGENGEVQWTGHRDKADLTGTWEWPGPQRSPLRLKIEKQNGHLGATYQDGNKTIPVTDFYDFGGGFYFTLFLGLHDASGMPANTDFGWASTFRESWMRRVGTNDGWVIGEAVATNNIIGGTIAFYPYPDAPSMRPTLAPAPTPTHEDPHEWQPKRVGP